MNNIFIILIYSIDILIVGYIFYRVYFLIKDTRALNILKGLVFLFIATVLAHVFNLILLNWMLRSIWTIWLIASIIIFQPEIRSALAEVGRVKRMSSRKIILGLEERIVAAISVFAARKIGAILVFERNDGLKNYIRAGIEINSKISRELLEAIFNQSAPLHDGAVIIQNDKIAAASCFLPLTKRVDVPKTMGTRHRAALGMTELSDALVIVVSEETGRVTVVEAGNITWNVGPDKLREHLLKLYGKTYYAKSFFRRLLRKKTITENFKEKFICVVCSAVLFYYVKYLII